MTSPTPATMRAARELAHKITSELMYFDIKRNQNGADNIIAAALAEAERVQMERDCAAVCHHCSKGDELVYDAGAHNGNHWTHRIQYSVAYGELMLCKAAPIRAAAIERLRDEK